jgi:hypothetical protein
MNSQRVSVTYQPKKEEYEKTFRTSFLIPLGPLDGIEIGKLTAHPGCEVCGEKGTKKCSRCQSASYCSAGEMNSPLFKLSYANI